MSRKLPIFYSALMLTGVNLLLRFVGTSFQVFLSGRIGAEGIGLLQLTMSVGSMAMVAGMGGIRTATMYLTAEEMGKKQPSNLTWVLSGCFLYSILFSTAVATAVFFLAPHIAGVWIGNADIVTAVRLFAVFLPVNCLCGVMTGYFTGANRIGTLAAVEVAEQLLSMAGTMCLLTFWAHGDAVRACQAVILGSSIAACMTLSCLLLLRVRERAKAGMRIPMARRLTQTALPLAVADDLRTGISTLENLMVPRRLALFPGTESPLAAFGMISGMVFPILMFPAAILFGLTELLIPELARCNAADSRRRIRYLVRKSLKVALIYGSICGGILFLTAEDLCLHFYDSAEAGRYLRWFSLLAVMLYSDLVIDAMIKGLGEQKASVRYNIFTNILDVIFLYILLPKYGVTGYFLSFLVTHLINIVLSLNRLLKITGIYIPVKIPMLTTGCILGAITIAGFAGNGFLQSISYVAILLCFLFLSGILKPGDILWAKGLLHKK